MTTDIATFLAHAIALEQEAAERYDELADAMEVHNDKEVAEMFRKLAQFSRLHLKQVKDTAAGIELPQLKPWEFQWQDGLKSGSGSHRADPLYDDALSIAFNWPFQKGTARPCLLRRCAYKAKDPEVKKFAQLFADEEAHMW